jgi:hypothetical protein
MNIEYAPDLSPFPPSRSFGGICWYCMSTLRPQRNDLTMMASSRMRQRSKAAAAIALTIALPAWLFVLYSEYTFSGLFTKGLGDKTPVSCAIQAREKKTVDHDKHSTLMNSMMDSYEAYVPAYVEQYIYNHSVDLGYASEKNPNGCTIWKGNSSIPITKDLLMFNKALRNYTQAFKSHPSIPDLRKQIAFDHSNQIEICKKTVQHWIQRMASQKDFLMQADFRLLVPATLNPFFRQ